MAAAYRLPGMPQPAKESARLPDQWGEASSLNAIAQVQAITNPRQALATHDRTLALRCAVGDRRGEAATYADIGQLRLRMGHTAQALVNLERARDLAAHQLERYIQDHSDAAFSHGICPECIEDWSDEPALRGEGRGDSGRLQGFESRNR